MPDPMISPPLIAPAARPFAGLPGPPAARAALPLQGLTVLAVEDSRFASEALRLMCHRSGARLRRAETLETARAHLRVYRPDVVIVDLGLPDGRGEELIRDLSRSPLRPLVILATSGEAGGPAAVADADGFLAKPLDSLVAFQDAVLAHLPGRGTAPHDAVEAAPGTDRMAPDPLALRDDLARAAGLMAAGPDAGQRHYLAGFVAGVARHAHDAALEQAAGAAEGDGFARLSQLVQRRLTQSPGAFSLAKVPAG